MKAWPCRDTIGREHPDLAIRDLSGGTGVLSCHAARRLALLEKTGLVDNQHRAFIAKMLGHIIAHQTAQLVCIPAVSAQKLLLAPRAGIARRFCPHPASLAPFFAQQSVHERARTRRRTRLRNGRIRRFTSRSDDAHNSSTVSIDAPVVHD